MNIEQALSKYGLNENQIKIYITLVQIGSVTIQELVKKSGIKRTTTYSILDNLVQRGLVSIVQKGAHREYATENPNKIPRILEEEKQKIVDKNKEFLDVLPELASIYNIGGTKPKMRFYEGAEGIKQVFEETLILPKGTETLAYASAEVTNKYLEDYLEGYMIRRTKAEISQRAIVEDSPFSRELQKRDKEYLREMILVDKHKFPFGDQVNIFQNKIFIASFKDLMAVLIESKYVADSQRAIFELAWIGSKQVGIQSPNPYIVGK